MKFRCSSYSQGHGFRYYSRAGMASRFTVSFGALLSSLEERILATFNMICR
jgi:hypothetical protein